MYDGLCDRGLRGCLRGCAGRLRAFEVVLCHLPRALLLVRPRPGGALRLQRHLGLAGRVEEGPSQLLRLAAHLREEAVQLARLRPLRLRVVAEFVLEARLEERLGRVPAARGLLDRADAV